MNPEISAGPYRVIAAGTVLTHPGHPISIKIYPETRAEFDFNFLFKNDKSNEPKIIFDDEGEGIDVTLLNINSPSGGGTDKPEYVAESKLETMFLHFKVSGSSDGELHELTYTIFAEPKPQLKPTVQAKSKPKVSKRNASKLK